MKRESFSKLLLLLVAMIWGSGFPATKIILDSGIRPFEFLGIRFFITAIVMFIIMRIKRIKIEKNEMNLGVIAGLVLFLAFAFQTVGLVYTTSSKNAFITGANVIFVPYIAWIFTKEKPKLIYILSSIICFIGIGFLSFEKNLTINFGDVLTFICAICFALQIVVIGSRIKNKNPFIINGFQMFSAGIIGILLNIIFEGATIFSRTYDLKQILALVYIILFNTFICYSIQTYAQKEINPSQVSLILTTEIIFGAIFSVLLLGDKMTFQVMMGGLLIFTSILLTEVKKR